MKKVLIWVISILIFGLGGYIIYRNYFTEAPSLENILKDSDFAQIKPPNNLISPGTIALIDDNESGVLKVICPCNNAFGNKVESMLISSPSTDVNFTQKLEGEFSMDLAFLEKLSFKPASNVIRQITLKLSNVKILELPDDAVFQLINERTPYCVKAINFRKKAGQKITLIKRVIQADAEYSVDFTNKIEEDAKLDLMEELSIELSGKTSIQETNRIIGKNLYWGLDDDILLGSVQPGELPSVGAKKTQRLTNSDKIYKIEYEQVSYKLKSIKQPTEMSCWISVYTMMLSWKQEKELTINEVIDSLGNPWKNYYRIDQGLPPNEVEKFLTFAGLDYSPPASYMPSVYEELLKKHGPIWIISGNGISSHARLLIGIYGDHKGDTSILEFVDPATGQVKRQEFLDFIEDYEREAKFLNENRPEIPFRIQIIYFK